MEFTLASEGFHQSFCADIPAAEAAFSADHQRPLAGVALTGSRADSGMAEQSVSRCAVVLRPEWSAFSLTDRTIPWGMASIDAHQSGHWPQSGEGVLPICAAPSRRPAGRATTQVHTVCLCASRRTARLPTVCCATSSADRCGNLGCGGQDVKTTANRTARGPRPHRSIT